MDNLTKNVRIFRALCDQNRLKILENLQNGGKCACVLLEKLDIEQSTLSHHMKVLCECKIVKKQKKGKWIYYTINRKCLADVVELLDRFTINPEQPI